MTAQLAISASCRASCSSPVIGGGAFLVSITTRDSAAGLKLASDPLRWQRDHDRWVVRPHGWDMRHTALSGRVAQPATDDRRRLIRKCEGPRIGLQAQTLQASPQIQTVRRRANASPIRPAPNMLIEIGSGTMALNAATTLEPPSVPLLSVKVTVSVPAVLSNPVADAIPL